MIQQNKNFHQFENELIGAIPLEFCLNRFREIYIFKGQSLLMSTYNEGLRREVLLPKIYIKLSASGKSFDMTCDFNTRMICLIPVTKKSPLQFRTGVPSGIAGKGLCNIELFIL